MHGSDRADLTDSPVYVFVVLDCISLYCIILDYLGLMWIVLDDVIYLCFTK